MKVHWSHVFVCYALSIILIGIGAFVCEPGFWRWFWIVTGAIIAWIRTVMTINNLVPQKKDSSSAALKEEDFVGFAGFGCLMIAALPLMWLGWMQDALAAAIIVAFSVSVLYTIWDAARPSIYAWGVWAVLYSVWAVLDLIFVISVVRAPGEVDGIVVFATVGLIAHAGLGYGIGIMFIKETRNKCRQQQAESAKGTRSGNSMLQDSPTLRNRNASPLNDDCVPFTSVKAACERAMQFRDNGAYDEALALFDRVLKEATLMGGRSLLVKKWRAITLCKAGRYTDAEGELEELVNVLQMGHGRASHSDAMYWLLVARYKGHEDKAMQEFIQLR